MIFPYASRIFYHDARSFFTWDPAFVNPLIARFLILERSSKCGEYLQELPGKPNQN